MWVSRGLLGLQLQAERLDAPGELLEQRLGLRACSHHQENEVVGVPDEPVGRVTGALQVLAFAVVAAHLLPVRLVLAV